MSSASEPSCVGQHYELEFRVKAGGLGCRVSGFGCMVLYGVMFRYQPWYRDNPVVSVPLKTEDNPVVSVGFRVGGTLGDRGIASSSDPSSDAESEPG